MTPGDAKKQIGRKYGTTRKGAIHPSDPESMAVDIQVPDNAIEDESCLKGAVHGLYVPTIDEIKSELWWIATGEGTESSRVSALRALADIMGLMKPSPPDFPEGMTALLDALAEGLGPKA